MQGEEARRKLPRRILLDKGQRREMKFEEIRLKSHQKSLETFHINILEISITYKFSINPLYSESIFSPYVNVNLKNYKSSGNFKFFEVREVSPCPVFVKFELIITLVEAFCIPLHP